MVKLALHRTSPRPDAARLPKTWSTMHETAWEWLWTTIAHNLGESTSKARGSLGTATATAARGSRSIDRPPLTRVSTAGHLPGEGLATSEGHPTAGLRPTEMPRSVVQGRSQIQGRSELTGKWETGIRTSALASSLLRS